MQGSVVWPSAQQLSCFRWVGSVERTSEQRDRPCTTIYLIPREVGAQTFMPDGWLFCQQASLMSISEQNYISAYLPAVTAAEKLCFESSEFSEAKWSWEAFRSLSLTGRSSKDKIQKNYRKQQWQVIAMFFMGVDMPSSPTLELTIQEDFGARDDSIISSHQQMACINLELWALVAILGFPTMPSAMPRG